jgi:glycosyltransferase involved in cell wall biosynthesis
MKIGFVGNKSNMLLSSGYPYFIAKTLESLGHEVEEIAMGQSFYTRLRLFSKRKWHLKFADGQYWTSKDPKLLEGYGRQIDMFTSRHKSDCLISCFADFLSHTQTSIPKVLWADANFISLVQTYPEYSNLSKRCIEDGIEAERRALTACDKVIYSSEWAVREAQQFYGLSRERLACINYGANFEIVPNADDVYASIEQRRMDHCFLLFVGVAAFRKGLDRALALAKLLNKLGMPTTLEIAGCDVSEFGEMPNYVKIHGFISKSTVEGQKFLQDMFSRATFFILPARAECSPLVLCEASAFGVPSLTSTSGGIPDIVKSGVNGWTFQECDFIEGSASLVCSLLNNPTQYKQVCIQSRNEFESRLNWQTAGEKLEKILSTLK